MSSYTKVCPAEAEKIISELHNPSIGDKFEPFCYNLQIKPGGDPISKGLAYTPEFLLDLNKLASQGKSTPEEAMKISDILDKELSRSGYGSRSIRIMEIYMCREGGLIVRSTRYAINLS